jgi:hypothetical protein
MKIVIQKNIPMEATRESKSKYPFHEMEVGDSFFIKCDAETMISRRSTVLSSSVYYGKSSGKKFKSRTYSDGFRIWRIK